MINDFDKEKIIYVKSTGKILVISSKGFSTDTMPTPDFDNRLKIVNDNIFIKISTGDSFNSIPLLNYLKSKEVQDIVVVGLLAEKCIYRTSLGGKERGYDIYIVPDAIIGKSEKSKSKVFEKLKKKGIKVISLKELIDE